MRQRGILRLALVLGLLAGVVVVLMARPDPMELAPAYFVRGQEVAPSTYYSYVFLVPALAVGGGTWLLLTLAAWVARGFSAR